MARAVAAALLAGLLAASAGAATPRRGGTIVVAHPGVTCLNPFGPCRLFSSDPVLTQVLEGAFEFGPDNVIRPNLVSRVTIGRNQRTLTYHIRPEARWSDGVPVRAADFHFTYRTFAKYSTPGVTTEREAYAMISRLRVLGPKTLRVELKEPYFAWRVLFGLVLPSHALAGRDLTAIWRDRIDNPKTARAIGSGPFLVDRLEPGRQLTLVRNPRYWGPHAAYLDRFVFRFPAAEPADPIGPLRRNEVDVSHLRAGGAVLTPEDMEAVRRLPGWRTVYSSTFVKEHLAIRLGPGGHPALRNRLVRQALAHGIDRLAITRRVLPELGRGARPLDSSVFYAGEPRYRPNWSAYRYDPARARRLLEQAGCRRGADGIYSCDGERLRLRFVTTAGRPLRERALQLMQTQLRAAGVEVEPSYVPLGPLFDTLLRGGNFHVALFAWVAGPGGLPMPESICGHEGNYSGYCSRLVQRDLDRAARTVGPARRARLLNAADVRLARDVPVLPLWRWSQPAAARATVRGFVPGCGQFNCFENSEDWWLAQ